MPNLASRVLALSERRLCADWPARFGHPLLLLETFVDPQRYRGTCYRAAGWQVLGHTSGRGLARPGKTYRSHPRLVLVKPLRADWRERLCSATAQRP